MEVRNEEMVPFCELSVHEKAAILVAQTEGILEYYHGLDREWYNAGRTLIGERGIYRTKPKEVKHVRNEELLPFHKLTEEEQETIRREVKNGNVEYLDTNLLWYKSL